MAIGIGTGTTAAFTTASWTGEILSVASSGASRPTVSLAHMGTTGSVPKAAGDLWDEGDLELEVLFDPADPPPTTSSDTMTVTAPDSTTIVGVCAVTGRSYDIPLEDRMTGSLTITWLGTVTIT